MVKQTFKSDCNWTRTQNHLVRASSKEFLDIQATIECGFTIMYERIDMALEI